MSKQALSVIAVLSVLAALGVGWVAGWFSHQAYVASVLDSAMDELPDDLPDAPGGSDKKDSEKQDAPPKGEPTDGIFDYEATNVETSDTYRDKECLQTYRADGEFTVVEIEAENVSDDPSEPPAFEVYAYEESGRKFGAHAEVCPHLDQVNPGATATFDLVFDTPKDTELTVVELGVDAASDLAVVTLD